MKTNKDRTDKALAGIVAGLLTYAAIPFARAEEASEEKKERKDEGIAFYRAFAYDGSRGFEIDVRLNRNFYVSVARFAGDRYTESEGSISKSTFSDLTIGDNPHKKVVRRDSYYNPHGELLLYHADLQSFDLFESEIAANLEIRVGMGIAFMVTDRVTTYYGDGVKEGVSFPFSDMDIDPKFMAGLYATAKLWLLGLKAGVEYRDWEVFPYVAVGGSF